MRLLARNLQKVWACQFLKSEMIPDQDGRPTGAYRNAYSEPLELDMNVSPNRGEADKEMFGVNLDYERVAIANDIPCPITETSILFVDKRPEQNKDGDYVNDYIVVKRAPSINIAAYAIRKVNLS